MLVRTRQGPARAGELTRRSPLNQADLSLHLRKLAERGLIRRPGNQQTPYEIVDEHATVDLLRAAAEPTGARYNDSDAAALVRELRKRRFTALATR